MKATAKLLPAPGTALDIPLDEKPHQREAFEAYCRMGETRSLTILSEDTGISWSRLKAWSAKFKWVERAKLHDAVVSGSVKYETVEELYRHRRVAIDIAKAQLAELEKRVIREDGDPNGKVIGWNGVLITPAYLVEIETAIEKLKRDIIEPAPVAAGSGGPGGGGGGVAIQINISKD